MDRILGHSWKSLHFLVSKQPDKSLHDLPNCGTYALHEAYQRPVKRRRTYCSHDLKRICHNKEAVDRYICHLSAYCKHTSSPRTSHPNFAGSDYDLSLHLLEEACPNLRKEENLDLKKRQVSAAPTTTTAANTNTNTVVASPTTNSVASNTVAPASSSVTGGGTTSAAASNPANTATTANTANPASSNAPATAPSAGSSVSGSSSGAASAAPPSGTATGSASSPAASSSTPTPVSAPPKVTSLPISISSSISVAPFAMSTSVTNPVVSIPTSTYSGQALLTAACAVPAYTALPLSDGSYLAAPLVGCAQDNPECCPSLSATASGAGPRVSQSIIPLSQADSQLVSALNAAPLTLCPADYTSTASNCCPIGFSLYNQQMLGQTPCFSMLPATLSVPAQVSAQISSLSSLIAATATAPNPTVSVHIITDQIFALSLPLKDGVELIAKPSQGLSLGAKIGIGVGAGLGAIIAITLILWFCCYMRKDKRDRHARTQSNQSDITAWAANSGAATAMSQRKSLASNTTGLASDPGWSPKQGHASYTDEEYIPGPSDSPWQPDQQNYVRMPPKRAPLQVMPTAHATNRQGQGQTRYSELPATDIAFVEADSRERSPFDLQQEHSSQQSTRYELSDNSYGSAYNQGSPEQIPQQQTAYDPHNSTTYYPPPPERHELGSSTPAPPRWMQ